jgi:hypothetical protein
MAWAVVVALLFVAATWGVWRAVLIGGAGFFASLHLHPYTRCEACKGTGAHRGSVFLSVPTLPQVPRHPAQAAVAGRLAGLG